MSANSPAVGIPKTKARFVLLNVTYHGMMGNAASATVTIDIEGRHATEQSSGVGPVNAVYKAIKKIVPHDNAEFLISHVENAKQSQGSDGVAHVCADFKVDGTQIVGEGSDVDTIVATAKAMVDALNQIACFDQGTSH
jgi:2-isopropylmalate synthase